MNLKKSLMLLMMLALSKYNNAQITNSEKDSLYIHQVENHKNPDKVLHAEPLYIDLIRDLGARKGEKEWNIGLGLTDNLKFDSYEALIEYEWAPIDRLGLEVELPFTFYSPISKTSLESVPSNQLNSIKLAVQWSFFVNEKMATSMAIGYINEFELSDFSNFGKPFIRGNVYNPFLVIAKRWGTNFHSLIYTGPRIEQNFNTNNFHTLFDINTSFHYMIPGTRNFIGVEINKTIERKNFEMTLRPQMRVGIAENLLIGIVTGIPINRENERLSTFLRLIWEPKHIH
ncbi:MAG: phosphoribosylformylglycinamidine synthase [Flavobacteriia bacterium]|nr:phosphoribosylformylglycinamidine synthase [Flavobacteriia bacterium]OIP47045.1 MAG: phosphoribosylformylglycinamidine synthase [Flavobacteriaceae bacterium CG2_30_31_66]PIV97776.1 MAG: phosphoribosylformylglycinamidine synthase [Flavobacteriaceae bacterium CG17_big_fil_post_rev_8_21_14_2_50_31_13]PIX12782.1 MAG: phosphoribosylformylglycinamidine synthase [Flavobacteriaceae bacterium CG_4_8_14_3_um_filter_31_8]PIY14513.1 MAG: phosphoribosylformylglycinamidine synthase [Flavobacteriaceae bact